MNTNINLTQPGFFQLIFKVINYNLKIVFGGKFVYFLLAALIYYFVFTGVMVFSNSSKDNADLYYFLLFPGFLVLFYPVIYNIQNDKDARMLEIIFSIPNYRYKIFLVRFLIAIMLLVTTVAFMASFSWFAVLQIPIGKMIYQLMFPFLFIACLSFLMSTITHNGNSAAAIMVIIGLFFFILIEPLEKSQYNIFLNPFNTPSDMSESVWVSIIRKNRTMLFVGSIISILWAFINLQRRDKFI